ncbi:RHS repeat domain-containing protein [Sorangium sp. So ce388]|uniref:RHS repeat domain-containing protein n=1 Tax=Sorangium sp. So ce388 TaxID=3133309 RepID=UPI003F5B6B55
MQYTAFDLPRWVEKEGKGWEFLYDAFGTRVKKTQDGEETIYVGGVYERREDASGTRHVFRVASPEGEVAQVVFAGPGDERTLYVHSDPLGSVGLVTDDAGDEVERLHYEPFGRRIDAEGEALGASKSEKNEVRHGFTGHRHDEELGLIDMHGRLYSPSLRRFLTPDPFVTAPLWGESYNRYSYVMNDPVNLVDPTGWVWKRVKCDNGGEGWVEFDDATGAPITMAGETIDVGAPPDAPPSLADAPPSDGPSEGGRPEFESDWASFVHAGDEYFEQGGGSSVGEDYSGTGGTLAAVLERGVRLSEVTGERPTPGLVSGSVMGDPFIVPRFNWSAAVARDLHEALDLGGLAWHAGNDGEALAQDLRAAMDVLALGAAVTVESGIGPAMVLGAVLQKLGGGAATAEAAGEGAVAGDVAYHYTSAEAALKIGQKGLWSQSSATNVGTYTAKQAMELLGVKRPPEVVIQFSNGGRFVPNSPPIVRPHPLGPGGGVDLTNPARVGPECILCVRPVRTP